MRRIGTLTDAALAQRFCEYLGSQSIDARTDCDEGQPASWEIWIRDENDVAQARAELAEFQDAPQSERYQVEVPEPEASDEETGDSVLADSDAAQPEPIAEPPIEPVVHSEPLDEPADTLPQPGIPITVLIILISAIVSLTGNFGQPRQSRLPGQTSLEQRTVETLAAVDPVPYRESGEAFASLKQGQLWRLITPMFLHPDPMQLVFNMLWIFFFGTAIERLHGSLFLLVLVIGSQVAGVLLQVSLTATGLLPESLLGAPLAIGASGAVYGLFGFLWARPRIDPSYPNHLVPINVALLLGWWLLCSTPLIDNFSSAAPIGGLIVGALVAFAGGMKWR